MAVIRYTADGAPGKMETFELPTEGETIVGSDPRRSAVIIAHASVRPAHARLQRRDAGVVIEDLSGGATFLDEQPIQGSTVFSGDRARLRLGEAFVVLRRDAPVQQPEDEPEPEPSESRPTRARSRTDSPVGQIRAAVARARHAGNPTRVRATEGAVANEVHAQVVRDHAEAVRKIAEMEVERSRLAAENRELTGLLEAAQEQVEAAEKALAKVAELEDKLRRAEDRSARLSERATQLSRRAELADGLERDLAQARRHMDMLESLRQAVEAFRARQQAEQRAAAGAGEADAPDPDALAHRLLRLASRLLDLIERERQSGGG
jgi:hypothetical protein